MLLYLNLFWSFHICDYVGFSVSVLVIFIFLFLRKKVVIFIVYEII